MYSPLLSEVSFSIYIYIYRSLLLYIGLFCLHKRDLYMTMYSLLLSEVSFSIYIYIYRSLLLCIGLFCHICTYVYVSVVIHTYMFIGLFFWAIYVYMYTSLLSYIGLLLSYIGLFCHICIYVYVSFVIYRSSFVIHRSLLPYMYICIRLFGNIYV